jgi:hypothetical protein
MAGSTSTDQQAVGGWPPRPARRGDWVSAQKIAPECVAPIPKAGIRVSARQGPCLSLCLIHPRPPPFTSGHEPLVRAGHGRWRTVVNGGAQSSKACEGASLPWVQIPPPPPLTRHYAGPWWQRSACRASFCLSFWPRNGRFTRSGSGFLRRIVPLAGVLPAQAYGVCTAVSQGLRRATSATGGRSHGARARRPIDDMWLGRSAADLRLRFAGGVVVPFLRCRWSHVGAQRRIGMRE